ncbi:MAG: acetylxylan esterase [Bacteroidales bacterium]|nr:acetylxylan esterase [Bacteroidales bacterium]
MAFVALSLSPFVAKAQPADPYELPDPLKMEDGRIVRTRRQWIKKRRPELMEMLRSQMFGREPGQAPDLHSAVLEESSEAFGGLATRRQVKISFDKDEKYYLTLLMYIPNDRKGPVPAFLGANFKGNHATTSDPAVLLPAPDKVATFAPGFQVEPRNTNGHRWEYEYILRRGYAVATFCYHDVDPDFHDGFHNGVHQLMDGDNPRDGESWGSISAWAWGLSRCLDFLETQKEIDSKKVAVLGHSRLGKTALWAGAADQRFALVIANDSGCSGAAIARRKSGETVEVINRSFPHWFCSNYAAFGGREEIMPWDQHELVAMIAPRPVYVSSASEDDWADPVGEYFSLVGAASVYRLFGYEGITDMTVPEIERPVVAGRMGHHIRRGEHNVRLYDWERFISFADRFLK